MAAKHATAEDLMRSRFQAFKDQDVHWLMASWHPRTRPKHLDLDQVTNWRRLQIVDCVAGGANDDTGVVEFRATYVDAGGHGVLHERSRFERYQGSWVYVDGEILD